MCIALVIINIFIILHGHTMKLIDLFIKEYFPKSILCFLALTGFLCMKITKFEYLRWKKGRFLFVVCLKFYLQHLLVQEYALYDIMSIPSEFRTNSHVRVDNSTFERVEEFKYLVTNLTNQNSITDEITSRLRSGNACYTSVQNVFVFQVAIQKFKDQDI